ncbi:MAG: TetR/AcrR family transcriptional regulator [Elusimicrobia bacterium]|nr:TetR/AcrR family transcriptional regulator [Elusimicrobiota bacterium]
MRTATPNPPTRTRLLDAARELMLAKGFPATSVDEICENAGVTKGCFFHYFDSKDELGKALIERWTAARQEIHAAMFGNSDDALERVYHYADSYARMAKDGSLGKGCLLGTFSQELTAIKPIREAVAAAFNAWAAHLAREIAKAKQTHAPKAALDPKAAAEHFIAAIEGAILLAKANQDAAVIGRSVEQFKAYLGAMLRKG